MKDLKFALRQLLKNPGFTLVAVLIVAIGIGSATSMFSAVNALVLRPLSLPEPERLVVAYESILSRNMPFFSVSYPNYVDWRDRAQSWESLAAAGNRAMNLTGGNDPEFVNVRTVTANFLPTLGVSMARGRYFTKEEDQPGQNHVVIVTHGYWQTRLGGAADVIGLTLTLDGISHTIVGVTAENAFLPWQMALAIPMGANLADERRMNHELDVYGRLKRGVSMEQADTELKSIAAQIWNELPNLERGWSTRLVPLHIETVGADLRKTLYVLLGAVGLLLLIACANVSNLILIRATARKHELAIRAALGAKRGRIVRQLLTESLVVTSGGGLLGVALSFWAAGVLRSLDLPRAFEITIDLRVLAVAFGITVVAGLIAGLGPALKASHAHPHAALKSKAARSVKESRLRDGMMVVQLAISLALLVSAATLCMSFRQLCKVNPGFTTERVLSVSLHPADNDRAVPIYERVTERIAVLPEVAGVGLISSLPLTDGNTSNNVRPVGPSPLKAGESIQANWRLVDGGYFGAMQIPLLQGKTFAGMPPKEARESVVLSASLARQMFGDANPIGRLMERPSAGPQKLTVIGVVGDVRSERLGAASTPTFYWSMHRFIFGPMRLVARTKGEVEPLAKAIRSIVKDVDPAVPVFRVRTMDEFRLESLSRERLFTLLLGGFAGVALLLSALGTYGVIAFSVQQRTHEIGIRMAVGAQGGDILSMVIRQGASLIALGVALGLVGAWIASRGLSALLYETSATDPAGYGLATGTLAIAALIACLIPARRASKIDPMQALRA